MRLPVRALTEVSALGPTATVLFHSGVSDVDKSRIVIVRRRDKGKTKLKPYTPTSMTFDHKYNFFLVFKDE